MTANKLEAHTKRPEENSSRLFKRLRQFLAMHTLAMALLIAVCTVVLGIFWGWLATKITVDNPEMARFMVAPRNPLRFMAEWDGIVYLHIARSGYTNPSDANFFPLYPVLVGIVGRILPSILDSGLLVAWTSFVGAIYFYLKIFKRLFAVHDNIEALRGLLFFVFFPTAVFLIAPFTEALFAFLALGAIYFALQKKFLPAAIFAMFCTATHPNGVAVVVLITLVLVEQREKIFNIVLTVLIASLGILSFMCALAARYKQPLLFVKTQTERGWLQSGYGHIFPTADFFNLLFIVGLVWSIIYWWPRRKSFAAYSIMFLCIPLVGRQFGGFNRYMLMAFPVQWMMYEYVRNRKVAYACAAVLLVISWGYFTARYASGYIGG